MKIIIFIGLKIVEIAAIVFVPYYIGKVVKYLIDDNEDDMPCWIWGIMVLIVGAIVSMVGYALVTVNWNWAGRLIE